MGKPENGSEVHREMDEIKSRELLEAFIEPARAFLRGPCDVVIAKVGRLLTAARQSMVFETCPSRWNT